MPGVPVRSTVVNVVGASVKARAAFRLESVPAGVFATMVSLVTASLVW